MTGNPNGDPIGNPSGHLSGHLSGHPSGQSRGTTLGGTIGASSRKPVIMFLCTGNSCRSQMAEGWAKALRGEALQAYSSGTNPHGLNPLAVRAMAEVGVDISGHTSKRPEDLGVRFDVVVTVCDSAHESCPVLPGARIVHRGFDDPPRLAKGAASDDEAMVHYRRVRDEIRAFVETLPGSVL